MNLTAEDRDRLMAWLEREAEDDVGLAAQCEQIGESDAARKLRLYAAAALIVIDKLKAREIHTVTVGE